MINQAKDKLIQAIDILPKKSGVYIFKDTGDRIIYVGKAKNLRERVRSYFSSGKHSSFQNHPISYFTNRIANIDFIETDNETEALILESSLIKKNRPKYNIFLKDDKSYPYIAITENEKYPRVFLTRNKNIKGARYFGPYTNAKSTRDTLEELRRTFQLRDCKKTAAGKIKGSACLNYHINLCAAPCLGMIAPDQYMNNINYVEMFLKGKDKKVISGLEKEMAMYARQEKYEEAQKIKNKVSSLKSLLTNQKIFFSAENSWDFLACQEDEKTGISVISLFKYLKGELAVINNFVISNSGFMSREEIIAGFIKIFYFDMDNICATIYLQQEIEDGPEISKWLSTIKKKRVEIKAPVHGEKKDIVEMVARNAMLYLEKKKFEKSTGYSRIFKELLKLKSSLSLANVPKRIECFDISNIQSSFAVGAMAVFVNGSPFISNYRHFRIRNIQKQDDIAMLSEVIRRRLKYLENLDKLNIENSFYSAPDLIVIDGGKAQYNAIRKVLIEKKLSAIDLASIAKKEEKIFCEKYPGGLIIDSPGRHLNFITSIRDEAHRFALNYHKKLRGKNMTLSVLDGIKGIGIVKKNSILDKFQTLEELKTAALQDFLNIKGLSNKDAINVYNSLHRY